MPDSVPDMPSEQEALAALKRYRQHPTRRDYERVQRWLAAAKEDTKEYARRIALTR